MKIFYLMYSLAGVGTWFCPHKKFKKKFGDIQPFFRRVKNTAILLKNLESKKTSMNLLQKIWKPESTNTVIFLTILESKERSKISSIWFENRPAKKLEARELKKMSCKKSGSQRKAKLLKCLKPKERSYISSIWFENRPAKKLEAGEY